MRRMVGLLNGTVSPPSPQGEGETHTHHPYPSVCALP
jgi:hypothetical protein